MDNGKMDKTSELFDLISLETYYGMHCRHHLRTILEEEPNLFEDMAKFFNKIKTARLERKCSHV